MLVGKLGQVVNIFIDNDPEVVRLVVLRDVVFRERSGHIEGGMLMGIKQDRSYVVRQGDR